MTYRYQDLSRDDRALHDAQQDKYYIKVGVGVIRALKGDVSGALLISHLAFLSDEHADANGWFWRSQDQIAMWTGMSDEVQLRARKRLITAGVLETDIRGIPARLFYRVHFPTYLEMAKIEGDLQGPGFRGFKVLDSAEPSSQDPQNTDTGHRRTRKPATAEHGDINKEEINQETIYQIISGIDDTPPLGHGAVPDNHSPESEETEPVQARDSSQKPIPLPPSQPTEIANGWTPEDLERLKGIVAKEYPPSGKVGYRPGKAALDALSSLPRDRANDFVKAVKNYAHKVQGEDSKWTRGLVRFMEDGFWEQFIKAQSKAGKSTAQPQSSGRDINGEADAVSHKIKMQNVYIPAFDKSLLQEEAS